MSILIMSKVFYTCIPTLSYIEDDGNQETVGASTAKLVLLAIADSADDFGENSYNGYERLGDKTSLDRRSVRRAVKAMILNGYLEDMGVTKWGTRNFRVVLDKLGDVPTSRAKAGRPEKTSDSRTETSDSRTETSDPGSPDSSLSIQESSSTQTLAFPVSCPRSKEELKRSTEDALFRSFTNPIIGYAQYPERIRPVVEKMEKLWYFKAPNVSKKRGGQFAYWIEACDEILSACGEFGIELLDKLYTDWDSYLSTHGGCAPYTISSPKSLINAVYAKAAQLRRGNSTPLWSTYQAKQEHRSVLDV